MRRFSRPLFTTSRIRLVLEVLEFRLPVSESLGTAVAMTALASAGSALIRCGTPAPAPALVPAAPENPESVPGRIASWKPVAHQLTVGSLRAVVTETPPVARPSRQEPAEAGYPDFFDFLASAAQVRPSHARFDSAWDTPLEGLARPPQGGYPVPADTLPAPAAPTRAPAREADGVGSRTQPQESNAAFFALAVPGLSAAAKAGQIIREPGSTDTLMFHGDRARTGWNPNETVLTPANVAAHFGLVWSSPQLDSVTLDGTVYPPHIYASPLYVDRVQITSGPYEGSTFGVVFTATSTGFVYAIKAFDTAGPTNVPPGTILWGQSLGQPAPTLDGGVTVGVLGTPAIDLSTSPPRLYVASDVTDDSGRYWKVFALDLGSGEILNGWPLTINDTTLAPINQNGPTTFQYASIMSQRGGLNLSLDGSLLYVPFGSYSDGGAGWMIAVDTRTPSLASAFAGAPSLEPKANGGMWGSGGPAVDRSGNVMDTTGNSPDGSLNAPGVWGDSYLEWNPGTPLQLNGTYTPWNYSNMDQADIDLGGGSPIVFDLDPAATSTPQLAAFGGKQGNAYLVDRANLKGRLDQRPPPSTDSSSDTSLLPPDDQPQFGKRGPLNIFGPYSEDVNQGDYAKARTTPAYFRGADGSSHVVYSGSAKAAIDSTTPVAPSVVRTQVVTAPGQPAYLAVLSQNTVPMMLPGSPVISSDGTAHPIVWVVDANVMRTDPLTLPTTSHPMLYAFDAMTLAPLWSSAQAELYVGGKYVHPTVTRGTVFAGTDRIQAFSLTNDTIVDDAVVGTGPNQVDYVGSWTHLTDTAILGSFQGTMSVTAAADDTASIRFIGTQIKLYSSEGGNHGIAAASIDGGPETNVDLFAFNDTGDVLVYTSPTLATGNHTLQVRNTGTHNPSSVGTVTSIDRFNITT